eukprot:g1455.t1
MALAAKTKQAKLVKAKGKSLRGEKKKRPGGGSRLAQCLKRVPAAALRGRRDADEYRRVVDYLRQQKRRESFVENGEELTPPHRYRNSVGDFEDLAFGFGRMATSHAAVGAAPEHSAASGSGTSGKWAAAAARHDGSSFSWAPRITAWSDRGWRRRSASCCHASVGCATGDAVFSNDACAASWDGAYSMVTRSSRAGRMGSAPAANSPATADRRKRRLSENAASAHRKPLPGRSPRPAETEDAFELVE